MSFPKCNGDSKQGQTWCANICYHACGYIVDTIATEDGKFAIYRAIETIMKTRVLHPEPGTIGFEKSGGDAGQVHECKDIGRSQGGFRADKTKGE